MDELIKKLTEERDEWRDKFHALNQTAGELCNACGWAFKIPGESCRCEVIKERDEARAEVERQRELKDYLRTWLSSEELEGLRVKAAEHPLLWEEIHHLKDEVKRLRAEAAPMNEHFEAGYRDGYRDAYRRGDEARAEVERLKREVSDAQIALRAQEHRDQWLMAQSVGYGFYKRGAEAMREACAAALMADGLVLSRERAANVVRALPIPEEP